MIRINNEIVQWKEQRTIKAISINQVIASHGLPYFCKLDIEGYEHKLISSLQYNIPLIEFEVIGGFIAETLELITRISNKETTYNYTINEQPYFILKEWVDTEKMLQILRSFSDKEIHINIFIKDMAISH